MWQLHPLLSTDASLQATQSCRGLKRTTPVHTQAPAPQGKVHVPRPCSPHQASAGLLHHFAFRSFRNTFLSWQGWTPKVLNNLFGSPCRIKKKKKAVDDHREHRASRAEAAAPPHTVGARALPQTPLPSLRIGANSWSQPQDEWRLHLQKEASSPRSPTP